MSRTSAIISACFTVSIPNSPSKSWSISIKSAGYPVCLTTTSTNLASISSFPVLAGDDGTVGDGISVDTTSGVVSGTVTAEGVDVSPPVIFWMYAIM